MPHLDTLLHIAFLYLLAAASPGPNFVVISQLSLSGRRGLGALTAAGIAIGSTLWATLAMLGVAALLAQIDGLYATVRTAGALYLVWLGMSLLWGARLARPPEADAPRARAGAASALRTGLLASLTNPKSAAFWTGVFAAIFPADAAVWLFAVTALMIAALSLGWHVGLALVFSTPKVQAGYRALRGPIDTICGAVLVWLGIRLAFAETGL